MQTASSLFPNYCSSLQHPHSSHHVTWMALGRIFTEDSCLPMRGQNSDTQSLIPTSCHKKIPSPHTHRLEGCHRDLIRELFPKMFTSRLLVIKYVPKAGWRIPFPSDHWSVGLGSRNSNAWSRSSWGLLFHSVLPEVGACESRQGLQKALQIAHIL